MDEKNKFFDDELSEEQIERYKKVETAEEKKEVKEEKEKKSNIKQPTVDAFAKELDLGHQDVSVDDFEKEFAEFEEYEIKKQQVITTQFIDSVYKKISICFLILIIFFLTASIFLLCAQLYNWPIPGFFWEILVRLRSI